MTYLVLTFNSTHKAIKAEKILEAFSTDMIPTPRQLSASCGISIKCALEDSENILSVLDSSAMEYKCYQVTKDGSNYHFNELRRTNAFKS